MLLPEPHEKSPSVRDDDGGDPHTPLKAEFDVDPRGFFVTAGATEELAPPHSNPNLSCVAAKPLVARAWLSLLETKGMP